MKIKNKIVGYMLLAGIIPIIAVLTFMFIGYLSYAFGSTENNSHIIRDSGVSLLFGITFYSIIILYTTHVGIKVYKQVIRLRE